MKELEPAAFSCLDQHFDEAVDFWKSLIEVESPFWNKEAVDRAVDLFAQKAESLGLSVRRIPCASTGDGLIVTMEPLFAYTDGIALMAHLDTVHEIGAFGSPAARIDDGWMYGPGSGDCKGGAVMALYTLFALKCAGYRKHPVKLILVGNEEGGRPDEENFLPAELSGSAALLNCETGRADSIVTSRKASVGAVFTVRGTAGHVGNLHAQPASAIRAAAEKILYLERLSDYENRTFSCGEIRGGSVFTSVPAECTFKVNCRIRDKKDIDWLKRTLEETAAREDAPGTSASVHITGNAIPMSPSPASDALFACFNRATVSLGYPAWNPIHSGGGSDASYAVLAGVPAICATGVLAEGAHTTQERANIADMKKRARIHIRTILDLPEGNLTLEH